MWGQPGIHHGIHQSQLQFGGIFVSLRKMREENANEIYHGYKAMVVLHICRRILGFPSPGYPGAKYQIVMFIKVKVV